MTFKFHTFSWDAIVIFKKCHQWKKYGMYIYGKREINFIVLLHHYNDLYLLLSCCALNWTWKARHKMPLYKSLSHGIVTRWWSDKQGTCSRHNNMFCQYSSVLLYQSRHTHKRKNTHKYRGKTYKHDFSLCFFFCCMSSRVENLLFIHI